MKKEVTELPKIERHQLWENKRLGTICEILAVGCCCDFKHNNQQSIIFTSEGELLTCCRDEFLQKFVQVDKQGREIVS